MLWLWSLAWRLDQSNAHKNGLLVSVESIFYMTENFIQSQFTQKIRNCSTSGNSSPLAIVHTLKSAFSKMVFHMSHSVSIFVLLQLRMHCLFHKASVFPASLSFSENGKNQKYFYCQPLFPSVFQLFFCNGNNLCLKEWKIHQIRQSEKCV